MAGTFPTTIRAPDYPFSEKFVKRKILSRFESGHELSRATATVGKHEFGPKWSGLPESEYQILKSYFESQGAETFSWTHPVSTTVYTVRIAQSEIESTIPFFGHRTVELLLHEVP